VKSFASLGIDYLPHFLKLATPVVSLLQLCKEDKVCHQKFVFNSQNQNSPKLLRVAKIWQKIHQKRPTVAAATKILNLELKSLLASKRRF